MSTTTCFFEEIRKTAILFGLRNALSGAVKAHFKLHISEV